ncbi:DUF3301 domain-containing protein [Thalassotalea ponticola]|uniref:DUF3301 domain-containing protein n=1 Tax=Thalassotalea ponticola TaxID=1523392 RepID=UPI0025B38A22|nr:DUF3301 domain-containing protein [Thalassotalea ponticola]MDN3651581.1 DUF3301 domain-containing protein [Thalassotalea ponticola]
MVLADIYVLIGLGLLIWYIWSIRELAEIARKLCQRYCDKNELQLISIARQKSRLAFSKRRGVYLDITYQFEFSGDGTSAYCGTLTMHGKTCIDISLPPYKV